MGLEVAAKQTLVMFGNELSVGAFDGCLALTRVPAQHRHE
jgi:hypothetical protein